MALFPAAHAFGFGERAFTLGNGEALHPFAVDVAEERVSQGDDLHLARNHRRHVHVFDELKNLVHLLVDVAALVAHHRQREVARVHTSLSSTSATATLNFAFTRSVTRRTAPAAWP